MSGAWLWLGEHLDSHLPHTIPLHRLSFIVDPIGVKASNSDAAPHWDDPLLENPPRPILMFRNDLGSIPIDLSTRPVAYRFVAYGQVNHIQGMSVVFGMGPSTFLYARCDRAS